MVLVLWKRLLRRILGLNRRMARIEKFSRAEAIEEIKKEMIEEAPEERPRRRGCSGCVIFLVLFLAVVGGIVWLIASLGTINIPVFTKAAYQPPQPWRTVTAAGEPVEKLVEKAFGKEVSLNISEASLTASLRNFLAMPDQNLFDPAKSQIAVNDQQVEIFLPLQNSAQQNALRLYLRIEPEAGKLVLKDSQIKFGNLTVPSWLTQFFASRFLPGPAQQLNEALSSYGTVNKIEYHQGSLFLEGEVL